jgi:hypothetical protein
MPNSDIIQIIPCGIIEGQQITLGADVNMNQPEKSAHQPEKSVHHPAQSEPPQSYVTSLEGQQGSSRQSARHQPPVQGKVLSSSKLDHPLLLDGQRMDSSSDGVRCPMGTDQCSPPLLPIQEVGTMRSDFMPPELPTRRQ